MKSISFERDEETSARDYLKEKDIFHKIRISSEYGKYKKGDFVRTPWGERFNIIEITQIKTIQQFKKEYARYKELRKMELKEIKKILPYKKIEILKLKKVNSKKIY